MNKDNFIYVYYKNKKYTKGDIVLSGHTHISKFEVINGVTFINPGSITIPKEKTKKSFGALVSNRFVLLDINGKILESREIF